MRDSDDYGLNEQDDLAKPAGAERSRAVGSPLPVGGSSRNHLPLPEDDPDQAPTTPPPARVLASPSPTPLPGQPSSLQRAASAWRVAVPLIQKILPLLDGNLATTLANILTPHPQPQQPHPPVNLVPLEDGLAELQSQHRDLRDQVAEQNSSLKRVEDQLEMVREATDRNTLEQQELIEDLKGVGTKVNVLAVVALGLLAISIILNVILYLHIQRVLP